jgi:hypothetical protein
MLAGKPCKIPFIDQGGTHALAGKRGGRNGTINTSTDNQHVVSIVGELLNIILS